MHRPGVQYILQVTIARAAYVLSCSEALLLQVLDSFANTTYTIVGH